MRKSPSVSWEERCTTNLKQKATVRFGVKGGFRKKAKFLPGHFLEKHTLKLQAAKTISGTERTINSRHVGGTQSSAAPSHAGVAYDLRKRFLRRKLQDSVGGSGEQSGGEENGKGSGKWLIHAFQIAPISSALILVPHASVWEALERSRQHFSKCVHRHP